MAPAALITLDTHEGWADEPAARVLALAGAVDLFEPSLEELQALTGDHDTERRTACARASRRTSRGGQGRRGRCLRADRRRPRPRARPGGRRRRHHRRRRLVLRRRGGRSGRGSRRRSTPLRLGVATAGTAIGSSGSLRLLDHDGDVLRELGRDLARPVRVGSTPGRAGGRCRGRPRRRRGYDIDVMRREIAMIPDVVSDVLDDAAGHVRRSPAAWSSATSTHLWLTGCGDSAFAGQAAALAFRRHTPARAASRCTRSTWPATASRYLPQGSAVVCVSFSGKVGRTTEAAVQARRFGHPVFALTNAAESQLGRAVRRGRPARRHRRSASRPAPRRTSRCSAALLRLAAELAELPRAGRCARTRPWRGCLPRASPAPSSCHGRPVRRSSARLARGALGDVPRRRAERGDRPVRRGQALRGPAAAGGRRPTSRSGRTRSTS